MIVYIYQADLLCEECGEHERARLDENGKTPADPAEEHTYSSDDYPKGPQEEGEADSPSHCNGCGAFLESVLTSEGAEYVEQAISEFVASGGKNGNPQVIAEWAGYYGGSWTIGP